MNGLKRIVGAIFDFLQGIVVILSILVMVYLFVMSPQEINGASMEPSFFNGEYILTNKVVYRLHEPTRGDVVIFKSPKNKDIDYIKRIVGLPGETVALRDNTIYIDDQPSVLAELASVRRRFLMDPYDAYSDDASYRRVASWREFLNALR